MKMSSDPIGTLGQAWGASEIALWRKAQVRQRSYVDDVLSACKLLEDRFDVSSYSEIAYEAQRFATLAVRSRAWRSNLPTALITGGVHGYETSGVLGALRFLDEHAARYVGQVNLLVVPCVSPWAYERVQRWNFDAQDPNRSFHESSASQEASALMQLITPLRAQIDLHIDLHETTDTDESEFRPALAARDGKVFEPGQIPDGFYLVADAAKPQLQFQAAIIEAVARVTHIADADDKGCLIGEKLVSHGVIAYEMSQLGLCPRITDAQFVTTTEVYPNSPRTSPEECIAAQVAAVCTGIDFLIEKSG